ncbi:ABC transporter substrate-binding protein [Planomonospora parontospora]|uniref:ABC transporter substrate-binding protein n=1 Tax=Planomonospora parontospora TaxID=58119 RepID=UPI00167049A6|nr:extracellular solute-binding protein [Planomonospora parontospora]GGL44695.1 sugar ABC transporter substrate-binding protein [Planomonospora parontospora subsp. antibiotica]GII19683.1 sugar ABC transporter substrate-binding protein [Planomonospora parontospora subsp. antibiotica]
MRSRALTTFAVLVGTSVLTLAGCAGEPAAKAPAVDAAAAPEFSGTLSILTKFAGDSLSPYFEGVIADYRKMHPEVEVELIQETDQSIKDKTKTLTASNALPDIYFSWTGNWAENFVRGGLAADLTAVIGPGTPWGGTFSPAALSAFAYDGRYYGIPLYNNGKFMGYNKAAFDKAGVKVPTSFEELLASCAPLREAGYEPVTFGNKDGWPALHYLQQLFAYHVPGDVLNADFDPGTAKLDHPGYVTALKQFKTLVDDCTDTRDGTNGVLYSTAQEKFLNGKAAMYYQEILEFANVTDERELKPEDFGIFPLPIPQGAGGDPEAIEGAPEGYLINARSPRVALAVDFMKFVTSRENAEKLSAAPYAQPSTVVGAVTAETSGKAVFEGIEMVNKASQLAVWLDMVTVPEVADAWLAGGEALITGSSAPEKVLESVRRASAAAK